MEDYIFQFHKCKPKSYKIAYVIKLYLFKCTKIMNYYSMNKQLLMLD